MNERYREYLAEGERAGGGYALTVPRNVLFGTGGIRLGSRAGSSLEFREHRDYQPGDDLRRINWSAYARSDRLAVKVFREEVNPHLDLVLDASRSMALPGTVKPRAALGLLALLAVAASNAGYRHCAWKADATWRRLGRSTQRPVLWEGVAFDAAGNPADAIMGRRPSFRPRGFRILISDLLWRADPLALLRPFADQAAVALVIQLLARGDREPPERGNLKLEDCESGRTLEVLVDAQAEQRFQDNLSKHRQNWQHAARQVGAHMVTLNAEELVSNWHLDALMAMEMIEVA